MSKVGAVLLDTRSIQKYVFSCNKLRTNVGASYIVDAAFKEAMTSILENMGLKMPDKANAWDKVKDINMLKDKTIEAEIAYIGGGNMLILVNKENESTEDLCKKIVRKWSKEILLKAPGLKTGVAIGTIDLEPSKFTESFNELIKQLKKNQHIMLPQVDLPYSGLTLECDYSGKVANIKGEKNRWESVESAAKSRAFECAAEHIDFMYGDLLGNQYTFANDLNDLGYKGGESYITIVHIDGNNMGVKFNQCETMQERKELSLKVASIVEGSFRLLLSNIIKKCESNEYNEYLKLKTDYKGRTILPIRPIIIGGDDITFVTPGRVGLLYAQEFIEHIMSFELLNSNQLNKLSKQGYTLNKMMSCCAGVAIVPAKYPFFRAYGLSEQLCSEAKKASRIDDESYIEYAILYGELYPSVEQLRAAQYDGVEGYLHYGPYKAVGRTENKNGFTDLVQLMTNMASRMPENKIKKLREALTEDNHTLARYWELSDDLHRIVEYERNKEEVSFEDLWEVFKDDTIKHYKTRYMDAIEIMDFMPPVKKGEK